MYMISDKVAEVQVSVIAVDAPIQAIENRFSTLWCSRSNLNVYDLLLGLLGHTKKRVQESKVTRTQVTRITIVVVFNVEVKETYKLYNIQNFCL